MWGASKFTVLSSCVGLVSSRAPVWGASSPARIDEELRFVSSRAPVWGASYEFLSCKEAQESFKSCPRVGGIQILYQVG